MTTEIVIEVALLVFLIIMAAFFSSSETGMMSINRYRLKFLSKTSKSAKRVERLLDRPDRLLGVILLGSTFVMISASSVGTLIAVDLFGENLGLIVESIVMTLVILIFAEVTPKTLAALFPEKAALACSLPLSMLLKILYPLVWVVNVISNGILKLFGVDVTQVESQGITPEELRTVVHEAAGRIPSKHRKMLLSILDLEKVTVDDIMVPRNDVMGLDLEDEWDALVSQLGNTQHTILPVYKQDLNNILGFIHAKNALHLMVDEHFDEQKLKDNLDEGLFVPLGTSLTKQMINFQQSKQRVAMVVDEYGDVMGLVTLEDILEEIVGEFTTNMSALYTAILEQEDGSYLVEGSTTVREFNRAAKFKLPVDGPKTINGLVIEQLQSIPEVGTCCLIAHHIPIEVVQVQDNRIKAVKICPPIKRKTPTEENSY